MTRPASDRRRLVRRACLVLLGLAALPALADEHAAVAVVERLHAGLVAAASDPDATLEQRYAEIAPVVESTHDLESIARLTIRRQWPELTDDERGRFLAAFERLSVMTYASRFSGIGESAFAIVASAEAARGRVEVNATISGGERGTVPLDYLLEESPAGWRIVNIFADGVSDLALKRAEYQQVLDGGSIEDLIDYVSAQADDSADTGR